MLPQRHRLHRSALFHKTMAAGKKRWSTPLFLILALPRLPESQQATRFGFIVSKKISNRANRRNRVKRRLRDLVRRDWLVSFAPQMAPYSAIVIIARPPIAEAAFGDIQKALLTGLQSR